MKCTASGNNDGGAVKGYLTEADKHLLRVLLCGSAYKITSDFVGFLHLKVIWINSND